MRYIVIVVKIYSEYTKGRYNINFLRKERAGFFVAKIVVIKYVLKQLKISLDRLLGTVILIDCGLNKLEEICMGFIKTYLASQSRRPKGVIGKLMGKLMNKFNAQMNETTIQLLGIDEDEYVLEIGFGNGKYIAEIIEKVKGTHVFGLDFSDAMVKTASKLNKNSIEQGRVQIAQGEVEKIPFNDRMFDKIFTVNTIYFWSDPILGLQEIKRVLKPGGRLVITFRSKDIMSQRTSDEYDFSLYTPEVEEVETLLKETGYSNISIQHFRDNSIEYYCVVAEN
jgi:ubiquinone/menaquinone biosynthesis C-methylase UbiE